MKAARIAMATALAVTSWAVFAKPAAPAAPAPQDIVAAREAGMAMSAATLGALKAGSANGAPIKGLGFAAGALDKWAKAMPALFAPSTRGLPSRAKPEIWTDPAGFAAKAAALASATKALSAAAKTEDKDAFATALASTGAACKGCHDSFQTPPPAPKAG
ncbi:MAG: cytochrome c [Sphingomonadales bacterium]|nr:cytochrome c [Sphingomonadales bacterium]